ncbi:hypothetical protein EMIHUDRAFT_205908 [Emiliania huxleyi CCMP1516]|uniref:B9 domain-containing protein 2 n=2 Tax=Emiliania huxleyi TaxID=2903 RepID=A0A0D3JQJ5_EMIH1|nr:hypothetical protein EMIHUDRAFT_205908 [Emiliania huxleyi CCMP1516]EOD25780.1 hypothetical protein EMIHUDRAFT_205908 [Emiliania huxleyi CCMP1516]|eukprot:XP_005778209.1 hypothetical protein EMIHUDRAFT_205908 [Emiliania huxleyi CCMP1516]
MAELHVVGQLLGGDGFQRNSLFCKWSIDAGPNFRLLQGHTSGQTHCDHPNEDEPAVWAHPLDLHYALKGFDGWPKLILEVWTVDQFGRCELGGYGCCVVPTSSGMHEVQTWRPCGTLREQITSFFLGGVPTLKHREVISSSFDRFRLHTETAGAVSLRLCIVTKGLGRYRVTG